MKKKGDELTVQFSVLSKNQKFRFTYFVLCFMFYVLCFMFYVNMAKWRLGMEYIVPKFKIRHVE